MDKKTQEKINSCSGNDGCAPDLNNGKAIVDKVRLVQVSNGVMEQPFVIECECGQPFTMRTFESRCPNCDMVYGVTPCSSHTKENIKPAGIDY
jgi:hypothetical protein